MAKDTSDRRDVSAESRSRPERIHSKKRPGPLGRQAMRGDHLPPSTESLRRKAVDQAWKQESRLVRETGKGSRDWSPRQLASIAKGHKIKTYQGHHIRSVKGHTPKWAGDPRNIELVTKREHKARHGGDFHNPTTGKLIDREKMIRMAQKNRHHPRHAN